MLFHGDVPPIMQNPEPCGTAGNSLSSEYTTIQSGTCQGRLSRPRCEATVTGASGLYEDIYCQPAHLISSTQVRNWNLSSGHFERTRSHISCLAFLRVLRDFVVRIPVLQFSSGPAHAGHNVGIGAVRPLHVFGEAAVGHVSRMNLQAVRQPRIFG